MRIEKLTENKIRIVLKTEDLEKKNIDLQTIMTPSSESQKLFLEMLSQAQKEVGFNTDGYRLLIEGFSSQEDFLIFTITKYKEDVEKTKTDYKTKAKKLFVKRKLITSDSPCSIYCFTAFEEFCDFCHYLSHHKTIHLKGLMNTSYLYLWEDTYYLILCGIKKEHKSLNPFFTAISEFAKPISSSSNFEAKIKEHGKIMIPKNAIYVGIKYFAKTDSQE